MTERENSQNPLARFYENRDEVIEDVVQRTLLETLSRSSEVAASSARTFQEKLIAESLEQEFRRLDLSKDALRGVVDQSFWQGIASAFRERDSETDLRPILERIIRYHAEEIAGHFDPKVYKMATLILPNGFNWMFRTLDWKTLWAVFRTLMNEKIDLRRKVHLTGDIQLIKNLSKKGTIVLVPTHFSNLDSVLLGWALFEMGLPPFCFGAGLNLFSNPLLGYFMNHLGAYKIDRRKKHSLYRWTLMNYSSVALENDCHSLFFPGGGRSRSGAPEFVEGNLKPGLLSTVLRAYIRNIQKKKTNPNLYIVPCVISYHVVLEATSLIEEHLKRTGANRFMIDNDESFAPKTIAKFIYNFMRGSSSVNLHFCRPLDPFGNLVSEDGLSRNQAGRILNLPDYITTDGEIGSKPQRDREYGLNLNQKILDRYKQENVVLSSHFIAYVFFEYLLQRFGEGDPLRLFKHQTEQCKLTTDELRTYAVPILKKLQILHEGGGVLLEPVLRSNDFDQVLESAGRNLAVFHTARPILVEGQNVGTEDLRLLYYYHNRLEGYGLAKQTN